MSARRLLGLGGGFSTPSAPTLISPGATDPRVRSFTRGVPDPALVEKYGFDAVTQLGAMGLVPPDDDLNRVALFAPPPLDWPGAQFTWLDTTPEGPLPDGSYREPVWADVLRAGTAIGRPDLDALAVKSSIAWWRQAYALGPLPEDEQALDTPGSETWGWPGTNISNTGGPGVPETLRRIYWWGYGKDGKLYKHMQLQKNDFFGGFHIYNKWAQNLTFVWRPEKGQWIAGWDFGDWFTQNKVEIVKGVQLAITAAMMCIPFAGAAVAAVGSILFGVSSFGLSLGVTTALTGAVAAQQAFVAGMVAIAKGDLGQAFKYFSNMVTDLGSIPVAGDAKLLPPEFQAFVNNPAIQAMAKTVAAAGAGDINSLVTKGAELAKAQAIKMGAAEIWQARALVPPNLKPWFDVAVAKGGAALEQRAAILGKAEWYASGVHDFGTTIGSMANPSTVLGIHAPRTAHTDPRMYASIEAQQFAVNPYKGQDPRAPLNALVVTLKKKYGIA